MKVLIVSKTKMSNSVCIGAIARTGQSLRLDENQEYQVGQVWDIDYTPIAETKPPHTEDVKVCRKEYIKKIPVEKQIKSIDLLMPPSTGSPQNLYDGYLQSKDDGRRALYIAKLSGVPDYSTTFWRPDNPLAYRTEEDLYGMRYNMDRLRIFYEYTNENGRCTLPFVGFQEPISIIPAHTLIRISLARWWRKNNSTEERCYAQLSGWYI